MIPRAEAPVLDLDRRLGRGLCARTSAKRRSLHRRRRRQLEELGAVSSTWPAPPKTSAAALEEAFRLHAARWRDRPEASGFATPRRPAFPPRGAASAGAVRRRRASPCCASAAAPSPATTSSCSTIACTSTSWRSTPRSHAGRRDRSRRSTRSRPPLAEGARRVEFLGGAERYKLELADRLEPLYQGLGLASTRAGPGRRSRARRRRSHARRGSSRRRRAGSTTKAWRRPAASRGSPAAPRRRAVVSAPPAAARLGRRRPLPPPSRRTAARRWPRSPHPWRRAMGSARGRAARRRRATRPARATTAPGAPKASSAFENTALAANPNALGSSHRNGSTAPAYASPNTSGSSNGPSTAAAITASSVIEHHRAEHAQRLLHARSRAAARDRPAAARWPPPRAGRRALRSAFTATA